METITDPAAIRASDEPDERGDFPCCTTPAPVSCAGLDLDAIEARANGATPGWWQEVDDLDGGWQVLSGKGEEITGSGLPIADAEFIATLDPPTVLALVAEVRRLTADLDMSERLLATMDHWAEVAETCERKANESHARREAAVAEVGTLRAKVAALQVAVSHSAESCADGPCEFHETVARAESAEAKVAAVEAVEDSWSRRTLPWPAWPHVHHWLRDLRAALATTGEGE